MKITKLAVAQTTTGVGSSIFENAASQLNFRTFQVTGKTTAGTGAVVVDIEATNDGIAWLVISTVTLTLSTSFASDGFVISAPWHKIRSNVKSISGTGATVTVTAGI